MCQHTCIYACQGEASIYGPFKNAIGVEIGTAEIQYLNFVDKADLVVSDRAILATLYLLEKRALGQRDSAGKRLSGTAESYAVSIDRAKICVIRILPR